MCAHSRFARSTHTCVCVCVDVCTSLCDICACAWCEIDRRTCASQLVNAAEGGGGGGGGASGASSSSCSLLSCDCSMVRKSSMSSSVPLTLSSAGRLSSRSERSGGGGGGKPSILGRRSGEVSVGLHKNLFTLPGRLPPPSFPALTQASRESAVQRHWCASGATKAASGGFFAASCLRMDDAVAGLSVCFPLVLHLSCSWTHRSALPRSYLRSRRG